MQHKKLLFVFSILFFLVFLFIVFSLSKPSNNITTTPSPSGFFVVRPGDTRDEVINKLGKPKTEIKTDSGITSNYSSQSMNRDIQIFFDKNNKVQIAKQVITSKDNIKVNNIITTYGDEYSVLYGDQSQIGVNLYVYPSKGIAMLANLQDNSVFEIWYFNSTTIESFLSNFGKEYSTDIKDIKSFF